MLCCSLTHRGEELLAQRAGVDAYVERGKTMGIPLLYPWANRLAGFDYTVAGRVVRVPHDPTRVAVDNRGLPIHGVVGGRLQWQLTRTPTATAQSLAAQLRWSASQTELFEIFPFQHDINYEARLAGGRLEIEVSVQASGEDVLPVAWGFHPYLSLPRAPRGEWLVRLPRMHRLALDAQQIPTGSQQALAPHKFQLATREFDDAFASVPKAAQFSCTAAGRHIALDFIEGYPCAQVYAPREYQFVCFEPMSAQTNALRSGLGLRVLSPGESYIARFAVSVEDVP
jgi:aldose 1-epimerase